ncbi:MAG: BrnT family toxin [Nitrospira sp.]|nr:BrnT family toxin [Nitrospira sp.]
MTLGRIDGRCFVVAYTVRDNMIRLISARKANDREQKGYTGHAIARTRRSPAV